MFEFAHRNNKPWQVGEYESLVVKFSMAGSKAPTHKVTPLVKPLHITIHLKAKGLKY